MADLDGCFSAVVLDEPKRRLYVVNDRMATIPMHYMRDGAVTMVAPEAKALLAMSGREPSLDIPAAFSFLCLGHAIGSQTLLNGISLMEPAQILEIDLDSGHLDTHRYWNLSFSKRPQIHPRDAASALFDALRRCHSAAVSDCPGRAHLMLTGGFDSRVVLGLYSDNRSVSLDSVTWGIDDAILLSDPDIARQMAESSGVPWRFVRYGPETFAAEATRWIHVSELASDNLGNFAAGPEFLYQAGPVERTVFIGDQLLGTAGLPLSREDAIETVMGIPRQGLPRGMESLIDPSRMPEVGEELRRMIARVVESCPDDKPKDLQDYLGLRIRIARWLNAAAYFREPMVSPRRPMLFLPAIEVFETLPPQSRVDKKILVEMLRKFLPRLMQFPKASANSLIDWNTAFTKPGAAHDFFRDLVSFSSVRSTEFGTFFHSRRLDEARDEYMSKVHKPFSRDPAPERILPSIRRMASNVYCVGQSLRLLEKTHRAVFRKGMGVSSDLLIRRLALIELFLRNFGRFSISSDIPDTIRASESMHTDPQPQWPVH